MLNKKHCWILISWLCWKPADPDLHYFQKRIYSIEKKYMHNALSGQILYDILLWFQSTERDF